MPTLILLGPRCSGKNTVADFLVAEEGYERVRISSSRWASTSKQHDGDSLIFSTANDFLDYATLNWRKRYVTTDRMSRRDLDGFVKRPWVLLVGCEARTTWRWQRRNEIASMEGLPAMSLEDFIREDDRDMFGKANAEDEVLSPQSSRSTMQTLHIPNGHTASPFNIPPPPSPELPQRSFTLTRETKRTTADPKNTIVELDALIPLLRMCNLHIHPCDYTDREAFFSHLRNLDLSREDRMRPGWDKYFMTLAGLASLRSNCMKRRVGAVLVSNKRVISTGYNGTPRGMRNCNEGGCARCNSTSTTTSNGASASGAATPIKSGVALDECLCLHAEENALLEAGRDRAEGGVLYCNTCPCLRCAVKICQTGCREVCYSQAYSMDEMSAKIFKEAGVVMRQIEMLD